MATNTNMTTNAQLYEFQPPANMNAIRSNIIQRIKKQKTSSCDDNEKQISLKNNDIEKKLSFLKLDSGLPSPPSESSCLFEDVVVEENEEKLSEIILNISSPTSTLPDSPPSPLLSSVSTAESAEAIRNKIRLLKQEKHKLFQTMKNLLSQPTSPTTSTTTSTTSISTTSTTTTSDTPTFSGFSPVDNNKYPSYPIERSRSQQNKEHLKSRPIIRSRSISHNEFIRPVSRYNSYYHDRRSPTRFYNNMNEPRGYPYNRPIHPSTSSPLPNQPQQPLMSRRIVNNNNASYVSSRSQLVIRPSTPSSTSSISSFRPLNRQDSRHSRY